MIEIFFLLVATSGVVAYARGRGASPVLWAIVTPVGYFVARLTAFIALGLPVLPLFVAWAWVGAVAFYLRFIRGAGSPRPGGRWNCPECRFLNAHYSFLCEACQRPFAASEKATRGFRVTNAAHGLDPVVSAQE